jgi:UDP-galactopyranose mutase
MQVLIVGCGLSGAVIAYQITQHVPEAYVVIIDKKNHIGGLCYDYIDKETGIRINKYGAHIFHTNNEQVWSFINQFQELEWIRWEHKVLSLIDDKYVPFPINGTTINELINESNNIITNDIEFEQYDKSILYEKLIKNYTWKQWNKTPEELSPSVLQRIKLNYGFDTRYFKDKYQVLPKNGYTELFEHLLKDVHEIKLNTDYFDSFNFTPDITIFTGPIDSFFQNNEKLEYRALRFVPEIYKNMNYFQPNSVINYPDLNVPYTRIVEYKHFLNQKSVHTIIVKEFSTEGKEETNEEDNIVQCYPVLNDRNIQLYEQYKNKASQINKSKSKVFFVGRMANYKYFNMDEAILNALECFETNILPALR